MYEAYSDYESMMNMAEEIVTRCAVAVQGKLIIDYQVGKVSLHVFCSGWKLSNEWSRRCPLRVLVKNT